MKKTILSVLTFAAIFASANLKAEEGNIYEVAACTEMGGDIAESAYPIWPMNSNDLVKVAGHSAYFRLRLASPDDSTGNFWTLRYTGFTPELDWALFPPQICMFVSGVERWATLIEVKNVEINTFKFTDLVFQYKTRPGDFALPIVLGAKSGSTTKPATDPELTMPEYNLDMKGKWGFEFYLGASTSVEAKWWPCSTSKPGVSKIRDLSLSNAGYNIQTVDFDNEWETNNVVWRSVHQDTTITVGALPKLLRKSAADEAVSLYVWSTNEAAVVVTGPNVEEVESDPENHPGVKFHVAKVTIGASPSENATGSFTIKGVSQTAEDGWSGLVLSPYKQFNRQNLVGEYYEDYVSVPVRCVDPLPPSVMVKVEDSIAYATSDYKTAATRIKVSLTQPVAEKFKVRLQPAFTEDNLPLDPADWGKYVRFSTTQDVVAALPNADPATSEVELGGGVDEAYVWLYALRGDEHTSGAVNAMEFKAVAVGTPPAEIVAFNKGACQIVAQDPEIVQPLDGDAIEAIQFDETPVTIKVQASYADMMSEEGYEIYVKYNPGDTEHASGAPSGFQKLDGTYKPGDGGTLERVDDASKDLPKFCWNEVGEYETKFYVVAPVSKKKSCGTDASYRTVNVNITPTKSVKVYTIDERTEFREGEQADLKLELSENTKVDLYAFLKIENDDVKADQFSSGSPYVIGMTNKTGKCLGIKIGRGKGSAASPVTLPKIKFLDGYGPATGEYLGVDFTVVLASIQDYDQATNQNKIVKGYESDTLSLVVNNVEPTVSYMVLGGFDSEKTSGYEYTFKLPMGQEQTLQAVVKDPSSYDLGHDFKCQWVISTSNTRTGSYTQRAKIDQNGNPSEKKSTYNFPYKGWTKIELRIKDKDMDDWPENPFVTYVEVLDKPTITVEPLEENPLETDAKQSVKFGLTYFDSQIPLVMKITVDPASNSGDIKKDGELLFDAQYRQAPAGYESHMATNVYFLTFTSEIPQDVLIVRMDGTMTSEISGFYLKTEILNEEINPKTGDKWCDYYMKNLTTRVFPRNVAPNKGDEAVTFSPDSNPTSRWEIAGGSATTHPLTWRLRSDVDLDFEAGIKVKIIGGGGSDITCFTPTNDTFVANFGSSQGDQEVTIQIEDKDGGIISRTWYFTIRASKFLTTVAHGPSDGTSTIKASNKYKTADGLGEGHVFAASPANFDSASDFRLKWNCSNESSVPVYAWGYKLANPTDNGTLDSHDQALDKFGKATGTITVTDPYVYTDDQGRDSFFYAWIMQSQSTAQSGGTGGGATGVPTYEVTISPEKNGAATVGTAKLPTTKAQGATANDTWPETELEAVFAREYLWSDNMGDINFDRIPDLYFSKYEFTTQKESVNVATGVAGTETAEIDDISPVTLYNDDLDDKGEVAGDFLPTAMLSSLKDAKMPEPFTAEMEIRGFGPALNNAPQLAGVSGVRPEIRYTDPDKDGLAESITNRSTLTKLEYLAWCDFAAANGVTDPEDPASWYKNGQLIWSPERPSRPDKVDSDGDGFPDGYEYWYWYRAHVGYYDEDGNHVYQTGRRFDPRNPGRGDLISSAEIETMMDPLTPADIAAKFADSDNDGIPDLLELKLGTDPFDFDTDGDGLPDGWEVVVSNTDPCGVTPDASLNADGDAMAISSPELEKLVLPQPLKIVPFQTFALFDPEGDSAGVQWYATQDAAEIQLTDETEEMYVITLDNGEKYASRTFPYVSVNQTLAKALEPADTFWLKDGVVTMPTYLPAGVKVASAPATAAEKTECTVKKLAATLDAKTTHACWVYGRDAAKDASKAEFTTAAASAGFLALGRNQEAPADAQVCWLPSTEIDVAYLHYMVYQQFGFDPRTAWKPTDPTAARWSATDKGSGVYEGLGLRGQGGYASFVTRSRPYTAYDEFLVMSFFLNNGTLEDVADAIPTPNNTWGTIWSKYTTNPRGVGQTVAESPETSTDETDENAPEPVVAVDFNDNGADTDQDGVPDGWELYVMSGPKKDGAFVYAPPYSGFETANGSPMKSYWSPFVNEAKSTATDNPLNIGYDATDGLTQFREFGGTDTIAYYTSVSSNQTAEVTIVRAQEDAQWLNKFFPTDPWNSDTDGDGVKDNAEGTSFVYGTPADDGKIWSIPGGGLNPCAIDTDLDGLPDGWEQQFKGSKVYDGEDAQYVTVAGQNAGNPLEGYVDGMDGTVPDAYTVAKTHANETSTVHTWKSVDGRRLSGSVNRDYDHDGLENWQEYLTGTMRCWRYDDPYSRWEAIPTELYWDASGNWAPDFGALGVADEAEFWVKTLFDAKSEIYNPHLVTGMNGGQYFSRVTNGWDLAYIDAVLDPKHSGGAYYWLKDRIGPMTIKELWGEAIGNPLFNNPSKYASCSPINPDSDQDGMDDYYELFHGLNPLLGGNGQLAGSAVGPCDLIAEAYAIDGGTTPVVWAWGTGANYWMSDEGKAKRNPRGNDYDFVAFPWLNGLATADPDGDDIRNQQESIMPMLATETWKHSDPTPLWMTDSSYSNSLVSQYFALPVRYGEATIGLASPIITVGAGAGAATYDLRDVDGYLPPVPGLLPTPARFGLFVPDFWMLAAVGERNWMYSFEENEGFDTDHDILGDHDEATGKFANEDSDPLDADGPRRHQAMWFPGANAVLQTMPEVVENYPAAGFVYPQDPTFMQFTVECWVKADVTMLGTGTADQYVMIERPVWTDLAKCADEEYIRRNFQLSIRQGKWCAMYEPSGTLLNTEVRVLSSAPATTEWTHVAATYDGKELTLYVNGEKAASRAALLQPEYGASARVGSAKNTGSWVGTLSHPYPYFAILVGASLKSQTEFGGEDVGLALDLTEGCGWNYYTRFFKGYIDEVRIWDGARTQEEIRQTKGVRVDKKFASENRNEFYSQWSKIAPAYPQYPQGCRRYVKDIDGNDCVVPAELRYHFSFDSVPSAQNPEMTAKAPRGFDSLAAQWSRPGATGEEWEITWWKKVLAGYAGSVYSNPQWVTWIPNTVAHLPRFDGTTLDSVFWSKDFRGNESGRFAFANSAEPVSQWKQVSFNGAKQKGFYRSTGSRLWEAVSSTNTNFDVLFDFTGRHLKQSGDDLIPLGGAFAKYADAETGLWDGQGPSSYHEVTGADDDNDGLPNWWEEYAEANYLPAGATPPIGWDTIVNYNGCAMTARQAYLRDMARGYYADSTGKIVTGSSDYSQVRDSQSAGVPDWWMRAYGILGESARDDHDNDGLSNYVEYMLSEVFDFNVLFDPTQARSVDPNNLDYFYKIGELYAGEVFTDHDLVEDVWEDEYDENYASRVKFDPYADSDEDGWSNRSEVRYTSLICPIVANLISHYTVTDGLTADHPVPTLEMTLRYDGKNQMGVEKAAMVIQVNSDTTLQRSPDAIYAIAGQAKTTGGDNQEQVRYKVLGKWSNRHAIGTLTPGNINAASLDFEFIANPSAVTYRWTVDGGSTVYSGDRAAYDEVRIKLGDYRVQLLDKIVAYSKLSLQQTVSETGDVLTWMLPDGKTLGTVNLTTGEYALDLSRLKDVVAVPSGVDAAKPVRMEDQSFRIRYEANPAVNLPRKLYLGDADEGYVREGVNTVIAWSETIAENGIWDPGEPFGVATGVDIGWRKGTIAMNLTDTNPVFARIYLDNVAANDREYWHGQDSGNTTNALIGTFPGGQKERVRVVRYAIDGLTSTSQGGYYAPILNKVVMDKELDLGVKSFLHEGDFISKDSPDIDWETLLSDVADFDDSLPITNVTYRVVLGNAPIHEAVEKHALPYDIHRHFDYVPQAPSTVSPGNGSDDEVVTPNPTFKWRHNGWIAGRAATYTAFKIIINDASGNEVWNSGLQMTPPLDKDGNYVWTAPVYVDDIDVNGRVFANKAKYSWKVLMYNSRYTWGIPSSGEPKFLMNVATNSADYGNVNVAVKYYGPKDSYKGKVIRVRAYASPDFTGMPVASGYVQAPDDADTGVSVTGKVIRANCQLIGIPRGTYYLQAFIDSNKNNVCDPWESMGYAIDFANTAVGRYNPMPVTFDKDLGVGDLVTVCIEDADTDNDGLPDAWEFAKFGSIAAKGVELVSAAPAGEIWVNTDLTKQLSLQENAVTPSSSLAAHAGKVINNAGLLALALGAPIDAGTTSFASAISAMISDELVEQGVRILSLGFDVNGAVRLEVEAEVKSGTGTDSAMSSVIRSGDGSLMVSCQLYRATDLAAGDWQPVGAPTDIKVGLGPVAVKVGNAVTGTDSGFYKVVLEKK